MELQFSKYEGCGNNFVVIDMMSSKRRLTAEQQYRICDVRTGVGSDGVLVLEKSLLPGCVYRMLYYPGDGKEGSLCGNGSRCSLAFAEQIGLVKLEAGKSEILFEAYDGAHTGGKLYPQIYFIDIKDILLKDIKQIDDKNYFINTGSPHHVQFVEGVDEVEINKAGKELRWSTGCEVNFVQVDQHQHNMQNIKVRTFETGVEGETFACGTGSVASSIVTFLRRHHHDFKNSDTWNGLQTSVTSHVSMRGGQLKVTFTIAGQMISNIRLEGPARHVFDGTIIL